MVARTTIAADAASWRGQRIGVAIACVSITGRWSQKQIRKQDIALGELAAIELALHLERGPLEILTDAKFALKWISVPGTAPTFARESMARRIRQQLNHHDVRLVWTKGHSGHPLHDAADRLAKAALIDRDPTTARQVAEWIIADQLQLPTAV